MEVKEVHPEMVIESTKDGFSTFIFDTDFYNSKFYKSKKIVGIEIMGVKIMGNNVDGVFINISWREKLDEEKSQLYSLDKATKINDFWYLNSCNFQIKSMLPYFKVTAKSIKEDIEKIVIDYRFLVQECQCLP